MASQRPQSRRCNVDSAGGATSDDGALPNQDVLFEILLRIPARPLCRFRIVCKSWRSLLCDPQFATAHAARHRGDPLFVVCVAGGTYGHGTFDEIRLLDTSGRVVKRVKAGHWPGSSSLCQMLPHLDLVLLRDAVGGGICMERYVPRVLDPATGAVSVLPRNNKDVYCWLVFGRAVSSTGGHGEYKVLSLDGTESSRHRVLTVDGSGGMWRPAPMPPISICTSGYGTGVASKGIIYHLVNNTSWSIAAFDLEAEQWWPSLIQGPEPVPAIIDGYPRPWRRLAEMNGCLAAVSQTSLSVDIWLLMCSGSWSKQCSVYIWSFQFYRHNVRSDNPSPLIVKPLWVLDDGRVAFWVCSNSFIGTAGLWMYDPKTETCTHVVTMEKCLNNVGVGVYTGNLLRQLQ
ncbi:unnamed protein product [Urochloa humidicola]